MEMRQMLLSGEAYWSDYWNYLDFGTALTSGVYLFHIMWASFVGSIGEVTPIFLRCHGGIATFLIGIKVFYWMRLFKNSAFFIRLIVATLYDIRVFIGLMLLILFAFANFYMILNTETDEAKYFNPIFGIPYIDAMFSMYLIALGDFSIILYDSTPNKNAAYIFFLIATFMILVVFMNMLIAIMGSTFGTVYENQEENALFEQLQMIQDYIWTVDLESLYHK